MKNKDLKKLIAQNKLDDVIEVLLKHFNNSNNEVSKQIISVSNRYSRYKSDSLKGLENKDISKITSDLIDLIGIIEKSDGNEAEATNALANIEELNLKDEKIEGSKNLFIENISIGLGFLLVLSLSFGIGLFNGYNSRKLSNEEFYKRFIFSKLSVIKDKETAKYFLKYTCENKDFYHFNIDENQILDENFFSGAGKGGSTLNVEVNIQDLVGISAASSLVYYDNFFNYVKKRFKSGGNIKTKILFTIGLVSTYGIGKWIGTRKIPACNSSEITKRLEDVNFWKKHERYVYNFINNMLVLGTNNFAINSISNCPLFLMIDSTKISDRKVLSEIVEIEKNYKSDQQTIRTTNYDIRSVEIERFFKRNTFLLNEFNKGERLTETGMAWKFYKYSIYNYTGFINDYNFLFDEYIQKMK